MNTPESPIATTGKLDYRTVSTILGALRCLQDNHKDINPYDYPHFIDVDPLTYDQIDELCESINCNSISIE